MLGTSDATGKLMNYTRDNYKNGIPINNDGTTACCSRTCATGWAKFLTCGALIQADGWEIKEDYPW